MISQTSKQSSKQVRYLNLIETRLEETTGRYGKRPEEINKKRLDQKILGETILERYDTGRGDQWILEDTILEESTGRDT